MERAVINAKELTGGLMGHIVNFWHSDQCTNYAQPMHKPYIRCDIKEHKQNLTASERVTQMIEIRENPVNSIPVCGLRMLR